MAPASIGQQIKGYELRDCLGEGGNGAVYRAYQASVKRDVAIKMILPAIANQPDFIRRFEAEAELVARLEHLHIVPLYDYWRDPDGAYLVMRWLKGGTLRDMLKIGALKLETALQVTDHITSALEAAHRSGIVHRDLKPANIFLDEDGNAYLGDFGIAKDLANPTEERTGEDMILGTLDYISPEQARNDPITPRTDIYSFGVVLYEMLVGAHPFPNIGAIARLYKHLNEPLPTIDSADIPSAVNDVIQKATAKDPAKRYASASELALALRQAAALETTGSYNPVEVLTLREQEILGLIIDGLPNKEIAQRLTFTVGTVKWYVTQIFKKLGVRSRVQAIVRARELDLIQRHSDSQVKDMPTLMLNVLLPLSAERVENPYKGLRAFKSADYEDYFGQEKLIDKLISRLSERGDHHRFLSVIGPSGSGKSSLVKAGLIPALWRGAVPGSERWYIIEMLPSTHPLDELEVALTRIASNATQTLREQLQRDIRGLARAAQIVLPEEGELLLVIDQFEELFTLVEDEAERTHFLDLIYTAVMDNRSRVRVVITLRADFYDRPLQYPDFGELVRNRMETILPLSADGLERAIARPAERVGITFEPGLVSTIVQEIHYQPGALPLLQYALTELYEQSKGRVITRDDYHAIGKITGALAKRAEEIFQELSPAQQNIAQQMFLRLVTLGEGVEDTRRRTLRSELTSIADTDVMEEIIDTFATYRLLTLDHDLSTRLPTVEVAHEAILREWERLRGWLNASRQEIRLQRQLSALVEEWQKAKYEVSFLLRGARLEQFEKWYGETQLALTPEEHNFIQASLEQREREEHEEAKRKAHEVQLERRSVLFLRTLVIMLSLGLLVAVVLTGAILNERNRAESALASEQQARQTSDASLLQAEAAGWVSSANALLPGKHFNAELAAVLTIRALHTHSTSEGRAALYDAIDGLFTDRLFTGIPAPYQVAYSPDGRSLLIGNREGMWRYNAASGELENNGFSVWFELLTISPDTALVLTHNQAGQLIFSDGATDVVVEEPPEDALYPNSRGAFSPDHTLYTNIGQNGQLYVWDTATGHLIDRSFPNTNTGLTAMAFSNDGSKIAYGTPWIAVVDVATGDVLNQFAVHNTYLRSIAFSPDDHYLLTASDDGTARLWDWQNGEDIVRYMGHIGIVTAAQFVPGDTSIVTAGQDGTVRVWDMLSGQEMRRMTGHTNSVLSLAVSPDGLTAVSASNDSTVRLWNIDLNRSIRHLQVDNVLNRFAVSDDGRTLITFGFSLRRWDSQTQTMLWEVQSDDVAWDIAISPDENTILVANSSYLDPSNQRPGVLLNAHNGDVIRTFADDASCAAFSPDGQQVVYGDTSGMLHLLTSDTTREILSITAHEATISTCSFSSDGSHLISASADQTAALWDVTTGTEIVRLVGHRAPITSAALSPDGTRMVTAAGDSSVIIWDANTGIMENRLRMNTLAHDASFLASGTEIVVTTWDGNVTFFSVETGDIRGTFRGSAGGAVMGILSSDGSMFITGDQNGMITFWEVNLEDQLRTACLHLFQDFSSDQRHQYTIPNDTATCDPFGGAITKREAVIPVDSLVPYANDQFSTVVPSNWADDGRMYFLGTNIDYLTFAVSQELPADLVATLESTYGASSQPTRIDQVGDYEWEIHEFRLYLTHSTVAMLRVGTMTYIVTLLVQEGEHEHLYQEVFLPALEAFRVLSTTSPANEL